MPPSHCHRSLSTLLRSTVCSVNIGAQSFRHGPWRILQEVERKEMCFLLKGRSFHNQRKVYTTFLSTVRKSEIRWKRAQGYNVFPFHQRWTSALQSWWHGGGGGGLASVPEKGANRYLSYNCSPNFQSLGVTGVLFFLWRKLKWQQMSHQRNCRRHSIISLRSVMWS